MGDAIFVVATIVFFLICVAYVNWCDRIIGPDEFSDNAEPDADYADDATATSTATATAASTSRAGVTA